MHKALSQKEIDSLIEALNAFKKYGDDKAISEDILNNQVVLTQPEIDRLLASLQSAKTDGNTSAKVGETDFRVVLSQTEIDSLVEALHSIRDYDETKSFPIDIDTNQHVLSQSEIDRLIDVLMRSKS